MVLSTNAQGKIPHPAPKLEVQQLRKRAGFVDPVLRWMKKENFEIALYPQDPHSFVHPESWLDQYRRIFKLFEENLQ